MEAFSINSVVSEILLLAELCLLLIAYFTLQFYYIFADIHPAH